MIVSYAIKGTMVASFKFLQSQLVNKARLNKMKDAAALWDPGHKQHIQYNNGLLITDPKHTQLLLEYGLNDWSSEAA